MAMEFTEIKRALEDRGYLQADIARICEVSGTTVHDVIKGTTISARIRKTISEVINIPVHKIWDMNNTKRAGATATAEKTTAP